jgi:hypothetical protein
VDDSWYNREEDYYEDNWETRWWHGEVKSYERWLALVLKMELDYIKTPADFIKLLRKFDSPICELLASMLEGPPQSKGKLKINYGGGVVYKKLYEPFGGWHLILKRDTPGALRKENSYKRIAQLTSDIMREHGKRGAIKRVAQELKITPAAVRSGIRRAAGTHDKRRKRDWRK